MTAGTLQPLRLDADRPDESVSRRGLMSIVGLAGQGLLRLAITVVIARLAGSHSLGVVASGMALAQFLILLYPTTCGQAASRFVAEARGAEDLTKLRQVATLLRRRFLTAVAVLAGVIAAICLARGGTVDESLVLVLFLCGVAGQQFTRGAHYGAGAVSRVVILDIGFTVAGLCGLVVLIQSGARDHALLLPLGAAYVLLSCACWPLSRRVAVPPDVRRPVDRFVLLGSIGTLASAGLVQLSILQAAAVSTQVAGQYAAAWSLASPLTLISAAMSLVLYPTMAQAWGRGDREGVRTQLGMGFRGLYLVIPPIVMVGSLLAPELVRVAYGPSFTVAADVLVVLLCAVVATMLAVPCVNATTSQGTRGIAAIAVASLAGLAVAGVVWLLVLPRLGGPGVACGYALGVATTAAYAVWRAARDHDQRWGRLVARLVLVAIALAGLLWWSQGLPWWVRGGLGLSLAAGWCAALPRERRLVLAALAPRRGGRTRSS